MKITKTQLRRIIKEERTRLLKENRQSQRALEELRAVLHDAEQAVLNVLVPYEDAGDNSELPVSLQGVLDAIETAIMAFEGVENAASDAGYPSSQSAVDAYTTRTDGLPRERR
jgi:methylphosphotriester-DNA--protein-cysteine methyltransferase